MLGGRGEGDGAGGLPFTAVATITPRQLIEGARVAHRRLLLTWLAIAVVVALVGVMGRAWLLLIAAIFMGSAWWRLPRRACKGRLDGPRSWTITVSNDEYRQASDRGEASAYAWKNFSTAKCIDGTWVLRGGRTLVTFPAGVLDAEQDRAFRSLLTEKRLLPSPT